MSTKARTAADRRRAARRKQAVALAVLLVVLGGVWGRNLWMESTRTSRAMSIDATTDVAAAEAVASVQNAKAAAHTLNLRSADASDTLPSFPIGKTFKVGASAKRVAPFGAALAQYATSMCYACDVPNVLLALWVELHRIGGLDRTDQAARLDHPERSFLHLAAPCSFVASSGPSDVE